MKLATLVAILMLFTGQAWCAPTTPAQENRSKLKALKDEITTLKNQLFNRHSEIDEASTTLQEREQELAAVQTQIRALDSEIKSLQDELAALADRKQALDDLRGRQKAQVARELNSAYRQGNAEAIKVLLNQENPHKLARILKYHHYFAEARREKIERFSATIDELVSVENDINRKQSEVETRRSEQVDALQALAAEQAQRQQALLTLQALLESDQARLKKLNTEREGLENLIARLEETLLAIGKELSVPFTQRKGKMPWPVSGKVTKGFGSKRAQSIQWTGWLFDIGEGTPVTAIHQGRVVFSDYLRGQGLMIIVDHGEGFLSLYAHNQVLLKDVGDWVQPEDRLALAGKTGGLENSALYFEIRHNGKPQDPKLWLTARR
jgi:murein hydrolase activator